MARVGGVVDQLAHLREEVACARDGFPLGARVGLTEVSRGTSWREKVYEFGKLELVDRTTTVAVLVRPELFQALLKYVDVLEEEAAMYEDALMIVSREHRQNWLEGEALAAEAKRLLRERRKR